MGGGTGVCNPLTDDVGDKTETGTDGAFATDYAYCYLTIAACSGTLSYAELWHRGTTADFTAKVGVFLSADGGTYPHEPAAHDTLVGDWSAAITSTTSQAWTESSNELGGTVVAGSYYWLCTIGGDSVAGDWTHEYNSGSGYYMGTTGIYATPPATLTETGTWNAVGRLWSVYVKIK